MAKYADKDQRIHTHYFQSHEGVSKARNYAIDNAKGDIIVFVDGDDLLEPKYLEVMARGLADPSVDLVAVGYNWGWRGGAAALVISSAKFPRPTHMPQSIAEAAILAAIPGIKDSRCRLFVIIKFNLTNRWTWQKICCSPRIIFSCPIVSYSTQGHSTQKSVVPIASFTLRLGRCGVKSRLFADTSMKWQERCSRKIYVKIVDKLPFSSQFEVI